MPSYYLAPDPMQGQWRIPVLDIPANGAQLFFYVDGSVSTKQTAFKDSAGAASYSNPLILDSTGNVPNGGEIWFAAGQTYKVVFAPSTDADPPNSPYRTLPSLPGINDVTGSQTEWIAGPQPTFVSASQFTLVGDQTGTFKVQRRLKFTVTAGTVYGTISSVSFGAATTVNVAFTSGALDAGLTAVSYSLIDPSNPSIDADYIYKQASSVASAGNGTTNIWGVAGNSVHVTGTNATFCFSTAPYIGAQRTVIFDGALSLNSSAAITMPGNVNVTTAPNDRANVYADTATSAIISFYKQSGLPAVGASSIANSLVGNIALSATSSYFVCPTVSQGTAGKWLACGQITVTGALDDSIQAKLWDGTTVIDSAEVTIPANNYRIVISLSGIVSSPAGNINISAKNPVSVNATVLFNSTGNSKDSTLTVVRVG